MALYGIVADIHGNREALAAALALLDRRGIDRLLCLGDIVGYNADPDACAALLRERNALAIAGNHDLIGIHRLGFRRCSNKAMYALKRTRRRLSTDTVQWLGSLPLHRTLDEGIVLIHGGVRDVEQYMRTPAQIRQNAAYAFQDFPGGRLFFFGHSHERRIFEVANDEVRELEAGESVRLDPRKVHFVNPGSIDASRKPAYKLPEFAVLDTATWSVELHRVPYDDSASEAKARAGGYRIGPWTDRLYEVRRRLFARGA